MVRRERKDNIKNIDRKYILVPTFSAYSHFSPYILFLPLLVPILKTLPVLVLAVILEMEKADMTNGRNK